MTLNEQMEKYCNENKVFNVYEGSLIESFNTKSIEVDGCIFLKNLYRDHDKEYYENGKFDDKTGYECFVNSFHVENYTSSRPLAAAYHFLKYLLHEWKEIYSDKSIDGIISYDGEHTVVKVHIKRAGEEYLAEDINAYEEGVLVINSNELSLLEKYNQEINDVL